MSRSRITLLAALTLSLTATVASCAAQAPLSLASASQQVSGRVTFAVETRAAQATLTEAANGATVSLVDAATGNTLAATITDASGNFVLSFPAFTPQAGTPYVLEAVKGLAVGGSTNRAGSPAVRLRTLLFWNSGWQSLTNTTVNTGIVLSAATTAVAGIASLKKQAGTPLTLTNLVGKVSGSTFNETGTGLTNASDFTPVLSLVSNAITLDQDPLRAIAYDKTTATYSLATTVPWVSSYAPKIPTPGGTVTVSGNNLDRLTGRNVFFFGRVPAATWSVSVDRKTATIAVPGGAFSAPFVLEQPNGLKQTIAPFLMLKGTVGTIAGNGAAGWWDTIGGNASLNGPFGVVLDKAGNLFWTDEFGHRIRKLNPLGNVSTLAGDGTASFADAQGLAAKLNTPCHLVFDSLNNLYIADNANYRIRKITPDGTVSTLAGNGSPSATDGTGTGAGFIGAVGITNDDQGNLYMADAGGARIRKVVISSGVVTTLAGNGTLASVDGTGAGAQFADPYGIVADKRGNLYVSEHGGSKIRKIVISSGVVTTLAGNGTANFADGTGGAAMFKNPHGLAIDGVGNLYVADTNNRRIRKVTPAGVVTTVAGSGVAGFANGTTSAATFGAVTGVCVDDDGNIYVADRSNNAIRVVTP
ncbi:hypothetical protein J7643_00845 [bacterium]|nr:hypothetical protein [bacterium]